MASKPFPDRLYKYRKFSDRLLSSLFHDKIYLSDFENLNDPWEGRPSFNPDLPIDVLEEILNNLMLRNYRTLPLLNDQSFISEYENCIQKCRNNAQWASFHDDSKEFSEEKFYISEISDRILEQLIKLNKFGIFSLSALSNCPLLWSHYGDEHRGVCIGYSRGMKSEDELLPVYYGQKIPITASSVRKMLDGDRDAEDYVRRLAILSKAPPWSYENEWRVVGKQGLRNSSLEMEEIVFGLRCPPEVKYAVIKLLEERQRTPVYFEIVSKSDSYELIKQKIDLDEFKSDRPRRSLDFYEFFNTVKL